MSRSIDERFARRWSRRALTIPGYVLGFVGLVLLLPALLPLALILDLPRDSRLPATRLLLLAVVFLGCETFGLAASAVLVVAAAGSRARWMRWHYRLQSLWARTLFAAASRIFGVRVDVEGDDAVGSGPLVLLVRHASLADTLLPAVFVSHRHGLRLRYVLKRELLWDPCLDVVGQRLPNVFVQRGAGDSASEIAAVRALAAGLGVGEGVLIYPEGDDSAAAGFGIRPVGLREAIARALRNEDREYAATRWSDALSAAGPVREWGGVRFGSRLVDSRLARVAVPPPAAFAPIRRIGGATGWYYASWLWRLRAFLDLLVGGIGMRRGRPDPEHLRVGDALDWWRVEALEPDHRLRLAAEMRLPGRAWLEFEVTGDAAGSTIRQSAVFDPVGVGGLAYWYLIWPLHRMVFAGMLRNLAAAAEADATTLPAAAPGAGTA